MSEPSPFTLDRADGAKVELRPCLDHPHGDDVVMWELRVPNKPAYQHDMFHGTQEIEPYWQEIPLVSLLRTLTVDEGQALLGHCAHVVEQLTEHVSYCLTAMQEALDQRNFEALTNLNGELDDALETREVAGRTARVLLEEPIS